MQAGCKEVSGASKPGARIMETDVAIEDEWYGRKNRGAKDRLSRGGRDFRSRLANGRSGARTGAGNGG